MRIILCMTQGDGIAKTNHFDCFLYKSTHKSYRLYWNPLIYTYFGVDVNLSKMAPCQSFTTGHMWQIISLARNGVGTFSKLNYFTRKYSFPLTCHEIRVPIENIKVVSTLHLFKMGRTIFIYHKNHTKQLKLWWMYNNDFSIHSKYIENSWDFIDKLQNKNLA